MKSVDYQRESAVTLANKYHGDKVTMAELRGRSYDAIRAGRALDEVKKALFYGKGQDIGLTQSTEAKTAMAAPGLIAGYSGSLTEGETLLHMAIGMVTEGGEFLEAIVAAMDGQPLDRINLIEEIGDLLWYQANALSALHSTFADAMGRNNGKLRKRFPDGFTEHDALNRDLTGERAVLEGDRQDVDASAPGYDPAASTVGNGYHHGDPCIYCSQSHDDVEPGVCPNN